MKKRGMCMLLAALLLLGCWLPALAAEGDEPLWQQWGYASKADFCQRAMADYFDEPLTEEEYERAEALYAENLVEARQVLEEAWRGEGYADQQAYLTDYGYSSEEAYIREYAAYLTREQLYWERADRIQAEERRQQRAALGMTWDGANVQVNGIYLRFNGAYPEYSGGNLMVPLGPLAAGLGTVAGTTGDGGVSLRYGARTAAFVMGQCGFTAVASDGSRWPAQMPVASYQKNGDIYVPVRALGEALGLTVLYDGLYDCAVLVDEQKLIDQIDARFTILNDLPDMAQGIDPAKTYRTELSGALKVTEFDTIDGDRTYPVSGKMTIVHQGVSMHCDMVLDITSLVELMQEAVGQWYGEEDRAEWEQLEAALRALRTIDCELIIDQDADVLYFKSAALVQLLQAMELELPLGPLDGTHTWFMIPDAGVGNMEMPESIDWLQGQGTVGEALYGRVFAYAGWSRGYEACLLCPQLEQMASGLEALVGDKQFTQSGQTATVEFDLAKLDAEKAEQIREELDLSELRGKLSIDRGAKRITGNLRVRQSWGVGSTDQLLQVAFTLTPAHVDLTAEYHAKNSGKVEIRLVGDTAETTEVLPAAPPAGDVIIDLSTV